MRWYVPTIGPVTLVAITEIIILGALSLSQVTTNFNPYPSGVSITNAILE